MKEEKKEIESLHHHQDYANTQYVINNMPSRSSFEDASSIFSLLSDPTRMMIFWIICHSEECVYNIARLSSLSSPLVSSHLRKLKQAKIITSHRHGKEVHYLLSSTKEAQLLKNMVEQLLDHQER